ncbi:hypothetical protein GGI02_002351, partial [Coemansia sp. RSA 2322]
PWVDLDGAHGELAASVHLAATSAHLFARRRHITDGRLWQANEEAAGRLGWQLDPRHHCQGSNRHSVEIQPVRVLGKVPADRHAARVRRPRYQVQL